MPVAAGDRVCRLTALARHVKQIASLTLEVKGTAVLAVVVAGAVVDVSQVHRGTKEEHLVVVVMVSSSQQLSSDG